MTKVKQVDVKKVNDKNYILEFFKDGYSIKIETDESTCYRLFRQIKKELKLQ